MSVWSSVVNGCDAIARSVTFVESKLPSIMYCYFNSFGTESFVVTYHIVDTVEVRMGCDTSSPVALLLPACVIVKKVVLYTLEG